MFDEIKLGKTTINNRQVSCSKNNYMMGTYNQTESGKQMFINLHKQSTASGGKELTKFCETVLEIYKEYDIDGHVEWKRLLVR